MFSPPPPIQLSRDEIQDRLSEKQKRENGQSRSPNGEAKPVSLLRTSSQSPTSPRRYPYFGKGEKLQVSSPITPGSQSRFQQRDDLSRLQNAARADIERLYTLPPGFAEHPRQAPTPPRRPSTRPPDLQMPFCSSPLSGSETASPVTPQRIDAAPPIPPKSFKRQSLTTDHDNAWPLLMSPLKALETGESPTIIKPEQTSSLRSPRQEHGHIGHSHAADTTHMETAGKPKSRYSAEELQFLGKKLPDTPVDNSVTPSELYQSLEGFQLSPSKRRSRVKNRNSPTELPSTEGEMITLPGRLSAIPEDFGVHNKAHSSVSESSTPTATQWHLRGGSVVTVTPPELTPWMRYVFIQGPIKIRGPISIPRNPSVASLDPFQDAIDGFYPGAVHIPRRRSDDQVLDDVCNFFESFGFDSISFGGDVLVTAEKMLEGGAESTDGAEIERFSTPPAEPELLAYGDGSGTGIAEVTREALMARSHSIPFHAADNALGVKTTSDSTYKTVRAEPHSRKDSDTLTVGSPSTLPRRG